MTYDSRPDTWKHIHTVQGFMLQCIERLGRRSHSHDQSKLTGIELECFDQITPLLKGTTYGSDEYKAILHKMKPAITSHQKANNHHPEFYGDDGINGMDLLDLLEMLCDWKAASMRHDDGDIMRSIEINKKRFGIRGQLASILTNTVLRMGWNTDTQETVSK